MNHVHTRADIVRRMRQIAPPGRALLDPATLGRLTELATELCAAADEGEYRRFRRVQERGVPLAPLVDLTGETILVTGGTGCIGRALITQLAHVPHRRIVSCSRGVTRGHDTLPGVVYDQVDVRSSDQVEAAFRRHRPTVVFHLAAVRDPGAAERDPARAVATNVAGTAAVARAAEQAGVERFVVASTGKAVRYFTRDVYAASKKLGERIVATVDCPVTSAVRFTHVVDNSLILGRLHEWCHGGLFRLHAPDVAFYAQSARESAQLLLAASGQSGLFTLRDLQWPFGLLDLALGVMRASATTSPIHFCGHEPGYESEAFPLTYDPATGGELGPLVNALESYATLPELAEQLNRMPIVAQDAARVEAELHGLDSAHDVPDAPELLRARLADASWAGLRASLASAPTSHRHRLESLCRRAHGAAGLTDDHRDIASMILGRHDHAALAVAR